MRIVFFSPDRHIVYDGATPDATGVGGGITVRVRLAAALAARGHDVAVVCNCAGAVCIDRVHYTPLDSPGGIVANGKIADVLVAHTTGGAMDLSPLLVTPMKARLRVLALSGVEEPKAWQEFQPHAVAVPSEFVTGAIRRGWNVKPRRIFVCPYGVGSAAIAAQTGATQQVRQLRSMVYTSHPSKGLFAAVAVLRLLRRQNPEWVLHVFGGSRLWGGLDEDQPVHEPGVEYHGLVSQIELARAYPRFGFAMHLQQRQEPFGITLVEAMAAGCIAIASPAGAYKEIIRHATTGFFVEGDPESEETHRGAAALMRGLAEDPKTFAWISKHAQSVPLTWPEIAASWEAWMESEFESAPASGESCPDCGRRLLATSTGGHCLACGTYRRRIFETAGSSRYSKT